MNDKKLKNAFQKDVDSVIYNNLKFAQIKSKIEISEDNLIQDKSIIKTDIQIWRLLSSIVGIILVFSLSLAFYFSAVGEKYKESPFGEQLKGEPFGKKRNNLDLVYYNQKFSRYIDMQENIDTPIFFYEIEIQKEDDYYTCAYFKSEYYDKIYSTAEKYTYIHNYVNDFNIVDGKLITSYYDLYDTNVKWYQFSKDEEIPNIIEDYQLGLVLSSKDIYFNKNLTCNENLFFAKKIFINEFYNLKTKSLDSNMKSKMKQLYENINNKNLIITNEKFVEDSNIQKISIIKYFQINKNENVILSKINSSVDLIGEYKNQLEEIEISEYTENDILYGEYNYQEFCKMFFNDR